MKISITAEKYTYDYEGNRISKTVDGNDIIYYIIDTSSELGQILAEVDDLGNCTAFYTRGDELISVEKNESVYYYQYDGHGDVRFLTNMSGDITDRYAFDAFGNFVKCEGGHLYH